MSISQPLRAPQRDGAIVARPSLAEAGALVRGNQQLLRQAAGELLGRPQAELRHAARLAMLAAAEAYHGEAHEPVMSTFPDTIVMAGHQPELFHPGVWVKNFALAGFAHKLQATAVNLIVDNDTFKSAELRLPALTTAGEPSPHVERVRFDRLDSEVPYEEAVVHDEGLFAAVPERVAAVTADWGFTPLLPAFWRSAMAAAAHTRLVGERFVRARRALERQWGCHNLEIPLSRLCRTEPFAWFACHLLSELPRFHPLYNEVVRDYRHRHGIRSRNHPVPDLKAEGEWLEAPFWAWRQGAQRRGRLLVRRGQDGLELRVGAEAWPTIPLGPQSAIAAWQALEREGLKVRSRALTNTLFARLFLCDLFVHGIGGGLYDELTDELLRQFYYLEPSGYLILSATLLLPLPSYPATRADERRLAGLLRDLAWNPARHLSALNGSPEADTLLASHARWVSAQPQTRDQRRERFRRLRGLLDELRPQVADRAEQTGQQLELCRRQVQANAILRRRDYAFCLYPEALIRPFCTRFFDGG